MQARARRTREKIISQATRAFAERGFEATNLTEHILTPAGVSVGSFYHQFSNKREVLLEIFERTIGERHGQIKDRIRQLDARSFSEAFGSVLVALLDDVDSNPDVWRIQWREYESPDDEIRDSSMVGVEGWMKIVDRIVEPWYPGEHPRRSDALRTLVMLGMEVVRQYSHMDPDRRPQHRDQILGPMLVFADAGLERMLGDRPD